MATPKRKTSKSDKGRRRAHDALSAPGMVECPQCLSKTYPHRACIHCGHYKGRQIVVMEEA
ncbi:MAG: 50S ribosomal protein L32 [Bdellovibrionota bacterium]